MDLKVIENSLPVSPPTNNTPHKQPFISALLHLKEMFKGFFLTLTDTEETSETTSSESLFTSTGLSNTFHFEIGFFYTDHKHLKEEGLFFEKIKERREEIHSQKEHWRPYIEEQKKGKEQEFYSSIAGTLLPISSGGGGAYYLVDADKVTHYVLKPVDEDIFCLNNRKEFGSVFNDFDHRARDHIPLYRSAQTDAACWEIAALSHLQETTPKTVMAILEDERFYDFSKWVEGEEKEQLISQTGVPDKEKLISVQDYIPDSQDLIDLLHDFYKEGLSDDEIASRFDQKNFEEVCLFLWLIYDTDGHGGNFLTFVKRIDETGKKIYGIKKIDNGLSLPEKNTQYSNVLAWVPNGVLPLSADLKQKIADLPLEQILNAMDAYELSECKEAFKARMEIVKELSQREGITLGEIDLRLSFLFYENGKELALSTLTTQEIIDLVMLNDKSTSLSPQRTGTSEAA